MSEDNIPVVIGPHRLEGLLTVPQGATGLVVFAHGSGSSRLSPRNTQVARALNRRGLGTLLFDLLTEEEARDEADTAPLAIGLLGASTGAAAALVAAAAMPEEVAAVVSRGGQPDLAASALDRVRAPTLLIVGGLDDAAIPLNEQAHDMLAGENELLIVDGATHLFEEPGTLDRVIDAAGDWFERHLMGGGP